MHWPEITIMLIVAMMTLGSVFWIWMLIDCAMNKGLHQRPKTAWMIFILFTHWVGALIYFFAGRPFRNSIIEFEYPSYVQPHEHYQGYQHGYRSPESSAPSFDDEDRMPLPTVKPRRKRRDYAHSQTSDDQPQAWYPTEHWPEQL
jgi:hypothetical protein